MPYRDPSTWNATTKRFDENPVKNVHDKAALTAPNPDSFPGYDQSKDLLKYFDDEIYY